MIFSNNHTPRTQGEGYKYKWEIRLIQVLKSSSLPVFQSSNLPIVNSSPSPSPPFFARSINCMFAGYKRGDGTIPCLVIVLPRQLRGILGYFKGLLRLLRIMSYGTIHDSCLVSIIRGCGRKPPVVSQLVNCLVSPWVKRSANPLMQTCTVVKCIYQVVRMFLHM